MELYWVSFVLSLITGAGIFYLLRGRRWEEEIGKLKHDLSRKKYESEVIGELDDRIGTSVEKEKLGEIVIGALERVIDYEMAAYLLGNEKEGLIFKAVVRGGVNKEFVNKVKVRMLEALGMVLKADLLQVEMEEEILGGGIGEEGESEVGSFFNIPLVVSGKPMGVITVASKRQGVYTEEETATIYTITNRASLIASRLQWIYDSQVASQRERRQEAERRAYQAEVLRELEERIGYSLDVNKIIEIITGSLGRLLDYHTVAYMIKSDHEIHFKIDLQESVSRGFVDDVKQKMLVAWSTMLNQDLSDYKTDERVTGAVFDEQMKEGVRSYFNIPLVIDKQVVGLINVSSAKEGLYTEEETSVLYTITDQAANAVSKLKQVLETEKGKLNALVESLSDGLVMVDGDWNLLVINPAARKMLGLKSEGTIKMLEVLSALAERLDLRTKVEGAMRKQQVEVVDGLKLGLKVVRLMVIPVKGKEGVLIGAVVVFHDITEQKELAAMKEQFEMMVIHELRAPLTNIRATAENLLRDWQQLKIEDFEKPLTAVRRESEDMLELVNDLLDVAKLESGKLEVDKQEADLGEIIQQVVERQRLRAEEKHLQLDVQLKGDLSKIPVDSFRMRQVLTNLIVNALKFTENGGVRVEAERQDKEVVVTVVDTGVGIAKEDQERLFNKFEQLQKGEKGREGSGLGLVIVKGIVEAHGGRIWVESPAFIPTGQDSGEAEPALAKATGRAGPTGDAGGGPGSKFGFTIPL